MMSVKRAPPMAKNAQLVSCAPTAGWESSAVVAHNLNNITDTATKTFRIITTITTTIRTTTIITITYTTPKVRQRAAVCA